MDNNCLAHHGVKGQRWGVRRYFNYYKANNVKYKNPFRRSKIPGLSTALRNRRVKKYIKNSANAYSNLATRYMPSSNPIERWKYRRDLRKLYSSIAESSVMSMNMSNGEDFVKHFLREEENQNG